MMARRVGFVLTPSSRSSASGWIDAGDQPERGAPTGSAGTVSSTAATAVGPATRDGVARRRRGALVDGDAARAEHALGVVAGRDGLGDRTSRRRRRGRPAGSPT